MLQVTKNERHARAWQTSGLGHFLLQLEVEVPTQLKPALDFPLTWNVDPRGLANNPTAMSGKRDDEATEQLHVLLSLDGPNQLLVVINTSSLFLLHNRQAWQNFGTLDCLSCLAVIGADVLPCADLILGKGKQTAEIDGAVPSQTDNT